LPKTISGPNQIALLCPRNAGPNEIGLLSINEFVEINQNVLLRSISFWIK
jgi:hypothetical protein